MENIQPQLLEHGWSLVKITILPSVGSMLIQSHSIAKLVHQMYWTHHCDKYANLGLPPATSGLGNGLCMENQDCYMYMYIYGQRQSSALAQCQGSILVKQIAVQWDNIGTTHYNRKPFIKPTICQHFSLNKDHWAKLC